MSKIASEAQPIVNYTTAQQLGALRRELLTEKFTEEQAMDIVAMMLRYNLDFVVRLADIAGEPLHELPDVEKVREEAVAVWKTRSEELTGSADKRASNA